MPSSRLAASLTGFSLLAATAWLVSRVWLGLDFMDEMQYYGEIASLTRTGRFFHDDLFLQQLGYVFLYPFFKLHALIFPDQDYFILFARLLLLAAYFATGGLFWHTATRLGGFSTTEKAAGLAALLAWIPFQIFAFSYNTTSYLVIIALVAVWLTRDPAKYSRYAVTVAGLLAMLTYTHPPAGLVLILTAVVEAAWRLGWQAGLQLALATAGFGLAVFGLTAGLHGRGFWADLLEAVNFSRAFGVGEAIKAPDHFKGWLVLLFICGLFVWRLRRGRAFQYPLGAGSPPVLRWVALGVLVTGGAALLGLVINWKTGFFAASAYLGVMMLLAASVGPAGGEPPALRLGSVTLIRWIVIAALIAGSTALLTIMVLFLRPGTGYFAIAVYVVLLLLLAVLAGPEEIKAPVGLAVIGTITGAVFAFTSGNGLHNFGVGAASVIPFLFLFCARHIGRAGATRMPALAAMILPGLVLLLLANGAEHPYGEQPSWARFKPFTRVPAFQGLWSSPEKIEAVERFQSLSPPGALQGKRVLVLGPHSWLYFALGGQPATPILFMKFDGQEAAYDLAAARLFRGGLPDAIVLTNYTNMPRAIGEQVMTWTKQPYTVKSLTLPAEFIQRYRQQTWYGFSGEVFLLSRAPASP